MPKRIKATLILFLITGNALTIIAQSDTLDFEVTDTIKIGLNIFEDDTPIELTLKFNIKEFKKEKHRGEYITAELAYIFSDTIHATNNVKLKARGNFRRGHCSFPPFWINFKKKDLSDSNLFSYKKLKIVSHCNYSESYSNYILKEYLAYKMYNLLSEYSFRVRLLKITYIDTGKKNKSYSSWAIIIEPEDMMADRLNCYPIKNDNISLRHTDTLKTDILTFFQYLIGNSDYSVTGRHNVKLLLKSDDFTQQTAIAVPYDFDYSGLVNAHYAIPGETLGIKSVTERYFLGACRSDEVYAEAIMELINKKEDLLELITDFELLSESSKKEVLNYINSFYEELSSPSFYGNYIRSTCR